MLQKLFLLAVLLQGRRDADAGGTGEETGARSGEGGVRWVLSGSDPVPQSFSRNLYVLLHPAAAAAPLLFVSIYCQPYWTSRLLIRVDLRFFLFTDLQILISASFCLPSITPEVATGSHSGPKVRFKRKLIGVIQIVGLKAVIYFSLDKDVMFTN